MRLLLAIAIVVAVIWLNFGPIPTPADSATAEKVEFARGSAAFLLQWTIVLISVALSAGLLIGTAYWVGTSIVARRRHWALARFMAMKPEDRASQAGSSSSYRAMVLLIDHLNTWQQTELLTRGAFTAVGGRTHKRYTISCKPTHNVSCDSHTYCLVVKDSVPSWDTLLVQKILIEMDEDSFLTSANRS